MQGRITNFFQGGGPRTNKPSAPKFFFWAPPGLPRLPFGPLSIFMTLGRTVMYYPSKFGYFFTYSRKKHPPPPKKSASVSHNSQTA